jgi:shikimate kinase
METPSERISLAKHVFLIGMPGAGKSYWAKQLSAYLHVPYVDLDAKITHAYGKTINELFADSGEDAFRKIEQKELQNLCFQSPLQIIACGGGTPIYEDNMAWMKRFGLVIFINPSKASILQRIHAKTHRPQFLNKSIQEIDQLYDALLIKRLPIYQEATIIVPEEQLTLENLIQYIQPCINHH